MGRKRLGWLAAASMVPALLGGQSVRVVHRTPWDTLAQTYRLFLPRAEPRGLLVLLSDWGDTYAAFDRFAMQLPRMLQENGLAVVQINNTPWQSNYFTDAPLSTIDSIVADAMRDARVPAGRVVMGGVQMAGAAALRYAARCAESRCSAGTIPVGVFAVEATLDLTRFWRANDVYVRRPGGRNLQGRIAEQAALERAMGGPLDSVPDAYRRNSVYLHFDADGGRAQLLRNTAVRLYTENDLAKYVTIGAADPLSTNVADMAGLALFLRRIGNDRADIVTPASRTAGSSGIPGPHAWSLFDERDIMDWVLKLLPER
jgi:hypothetical protein